MAKGSVAKDNLIKRFITALGDDYVGTEDNKKFYFWSNENGERLQVAVTLTYAKNPLASGNVVKNGELNFEDSGTVSPTKVKEMDETEEAILARLREELGL